MFKNTKISEQKFQCVVSTHRGMQTVLVSQIASKTGAMTRTIDPHRWGQHEKIFLLYFKNPKNDFLNQPATEVMGTAIRGNVILISATGNLTADEIKAALDAKMPAKKRDWLSIAKKLPPTIPLTEEAKLRIKQEFEERQIKPKPKIIIENEEDDVWCAFEESDFE